MANRLTQTLDNVGYTENDMVTYRSALEPTLDLFYKIGNRTKSGDSQRGYKPTENILALAKAALEHNKDTCQPKLCHM